MIEFVPLEDFFDVEVDALVLKRTRCLVRALRRNTCFELISTMQFPQKAASTSKYRKNTPFFPIHEGEVLVCNVINQSIPTNNPFGIFPRERIAFVIPIDNDQAVGIFALRNNFPRLLHTNLSPKDCAVSLCLNNLDAQTVAASWTAERMLQQVQWWLEQSAEGTIHAAEQTPELPFFTGHELFVPAGITTDELRDTSRYWAVVRIAQKNDIHWVMRLLELDDIQRNASLPIYIVDLDTISHRPISFKPTTLSELANLLCDDADNLYHKLKNELKNKFQGGRAVLPNNNYVVILIRVKIQGVELSMEKFYAALVDISEQQLGIHLGALIKLNNANNYGAATEINGQTSGSPNRELLEQLQLELMEVTSLPTKNELQAWSGNPTNGPDGVLVGLGALGSELLQLWTRAGWGRWVLVDSDYLRPHNLARHAGYSEHIGMRKVAVAKQLAESINPSADDLLVFNEDICTTRAPELANALSNAELIVDATAGLPFSRRAGMDSNSKRITSLFLTPNGMGTVLMIEDKARNLPIHAIEAQYYRTLISSDCLADHLAPASDLFRSGTGCRDKSFVMPHSRVLAHAAILAEQTQLLSARDSGACRIWQHTQETGAVVMKEIALSTIVTRNSDDFTVIYDEGLIIKLRQYRQQGLSAGGRETGGVLFGYVDFSLMIIMLVDAFPAPPDSIATTTGFTRGVVGVSEACQLVSQRTLNQVNYVGEWHSHPRGHSAKHSPT
ncbi:ThiF family adenylyltransferase [Undibacterium fentianense]|uniref:ThiF family adenylyltransferase n=1 Tax=Undibacterium fentianense TaxID=2828728 RepID=A0A941E082_9BURK|nr:ThiF family adenylyltransferase [Undibacterium fentianense]MBR7798536.1 ThiF family adenylyltransferase [Undibacterium fentianense]